MSKLMTDDQFITHLWALAAGTVQPIDPDNGLCAEVRRLWDQGRISAMQEAHIDDLMAVYTERFNLCAVYPVEGGRREFQENRRKWEDPRRRRMLVWLADNFKELNDAD